MVTLDALQGAYDFVVLAASRRIGVDETLAISHLATDAAVIGGDLYAAREMAAALEQGGLPQPLVIVEDPQEKSAA